MPSRRLHHPDDKTSAKSPKPRRGDLSVESVVLGTRVIKPWYSSLYREELIGPSPVDILFVCPHCFKYSRDCTASLAHQRLCDFAFEIPGGVIWTQDRYSLHELEGETHRLFTQNLSLFAKLFIENKSVCFDVNTFDYYLLVDTNKDDSTSDIVGFFSKEKLSWDNNNLACILVFPPWQKLGLGQMLMDASYKISKHEGRLGGPERRRQSYLVYWSRAIAQAVLARPANRAVSVMEISEDTNILPEDIVATLVHMDVLEGRRKDESIVVSKATTKQWLQRHRIDPKSPIDERGFLWLDE